MAFTQNLSWCHFQKQNTERDGAYVWEQCDISLSFYNKSKLNLNYFDDFHPPNFNKSEFKCWNNIRASPILLFSDKNCGHEWLPKVTHLISGRPQTIICYISLLCLLDFVALMFSLLVSVSVTCSSRSVYMAVHACSVMSDSFRPHGLWPASLLYSWDFPGKNIGVGCHFLLQRISPTQGSNLYLLHWEGD